MLERLTITNYHYTYLEPVHGTTHVAVLYQYNHQETEDPIKRQEQNKLQQAVWILQRRKLQVRFV